MIESKHLLNILSWLLLCKNIITNYILQLKRRRSCYFIVIRNLAMDLREWPTEAFVKIIKREWLLYNELTDHEGSWASRIEGLLSIYVFCKKQTNICMTHYSSGEIWFDIIDVELLTPADETSCNTCLTQYITNFF